MFYSNFVPKTAKDIVKLLPRTRSHMKYSTSKMPWPWNRGQGSLNVTEPIRIDPPPMTSYQRSISNMSLYRTVSEIDVDFSQKSPMFLTPVYFAPPPSSIPLGISAGEGQKTRMMWLRVRETRLTISLVVWIQCTNATDGGTDGRTPGDSKGRAYA